MNSNQAFFFLSFLTECFRPFLLQRRKIIESTISPFSRFLRSDFRSFRELNILSTLHWVGGRANIRSATSFSSFSRFRPFWVDLDQKKISKFFSPREGGRLTPGKKFLKIFFWSKSTKNGLKREKSQKKIFRGAEFFFF